MLHSDAEILSEVYNLPDEEEPVQQYHIEVPPPLPGMASQQALRAKNMVL